MSAASMFDPPLDEPVPGLEYAIPVFSFIFTACRMHMNQFEGLGLLSKPGRTFLCSLVGAGLGYATWYASIEADKKIKNYLKAIDKEIEYVNQAWDILATAEEAKQELAIKEGKMKECERKIFKRPWIKVPEGRKKLLEWQEASRKAKEGTVSSTNVVTQ